MNIIPEELESYEYWDNLDPVSATYIIADLVRLINEWGAGIEVAGSAKQLRYPTYEPPVEVVEEVPVNVPVED